MEYTIEYTYIFVYPSRIYGDVVSEVTSIRVSRSTLEMLERLRDTLKAGSIDEAIQALVMRQRKAVIDEVFGLDKGRVEPFTEEDRGEDRS